jgi:hypothetical protein
MHPQLSEIITQSTQRLLNELEATTPNMAEPVSAWMRALAGGHAPEAYFKHPLAFPTLLMPWWLEESLHAEMDLDFQADIAYSSINGYYFIRMIDNVMDDDSETEKKLLPALAFFHTEFQTAYHKHFAPAHPFWELYRSVWFGTAQAAIHDASVGEITLEMFEQASAQKVSAALIPVAAVCYKYQRPELIAPWSKFVHRIGMWHQGFNDIFDWHKDSANGSQTYFLSEAKRLKRENETVTEWIIRDGFAQGCDTMRTWMQEAQHLAKTLNNATLVQYLEERAELFDKRAQDSINGFKILSKLSANLT